MRPPNPSRSLLALTVVILPALLFPGTGNGQEARLETAVASLRFRELGPAIMGGRIAQAADDAIIPKSLKYVLIGPETASEIRLAD